MSGQAQLIIGPMFSGKSTELIRRLDRYIIGGKSVITVKYKHDIRYDKKKICTHDGKNGRYETIVSDEFLEMSLDLTKYDVIGIDEGQFYENIVPFVEKYVNEGKILIIAALNGTFEKKPFPNVIDLYAMVEQIDKLASVCKLCGNDAHFSKRLTDDQSLQIIGGLEMYSARCRQCFEK